MRTRTARAAQRDTEGGRGAGGRLTDALVAVAGGEVEGRPSLVVGRAGVNVVLQEASHWGGEQTAAVMRKRAETAARGHTLG